MFLFNGGGRIRATREPAPTSGPLFALVRGTLELRLGRAGGSVSRVRRDPGTVAYCGGDRGGTCRERLLLCPALQRGGRSRAGNGSGVSLTWIRLARCCCVGIGDSSVWPHSALQYVVVQRRLSVGRSQIGSGSPCKRVEPVLERASTLHGILVLCRCPHLAKAKRQRRLLK